MDAKELQRLKKTTPFEPFRLVMSDGAVYDVIGPEWFDVGTKSSYLKIPSTEQPELLDYMLRLSNDHITHTWPLEAVRQRERGADPAAG